MPPKKRWWFLDPREWLKLAYETFGVKHPIGSLIGVMILFALSGAAIWMISANLYEKAHATEQATTKSPKSGSGQVADCGINVDGNGNKIGDVNCKADQSSK